MFFNEDLNSAIKNSSTVKMNSSVIAEWNLNDPENIENVGNYRYRWTEPRSAYKILPSSYDSLDNPGNQCVKYWTGATSSDNMIEGFYDDNDEPTIFLEEDERFKYLYSLDDCFTPHRPRSGINYPLYFSDRFFDGLVSAERPRYYLSHKDNDFKYHTSFRKVASLENPTPTYDVYDDPVPPAKCGDEFTGVTGLSFESQGLNPIWDTVPFVVYKNIIPTNKIVVKMQTNIGTEKINNVTDMYGNVISDPLHGEENATVPKSWKIQVLKGDSWVTAKEFSEMERRADGSPVIGPDGYVELNYGPVFPTSVERLPKRNLGTLTSPTLLPKTARQGDFFYVSAAQSAPGAIYIFNGDSEWQPFIPTFGWGFYGDYDGSLFGVNAVSDFTNPTSFAIGGETVYAEFDYIRGLRIVVDTMNGPGQTFDLIELSPRLRADVTDMTQSISVTKTVGDIDQTALPVGGLKASTGQITLFDFDDSFKEENSGSIISGLASTDLTFSIYDRVDSETSTYYVPVKTLYSEAKRPEISERGLVKYSLRDAFYLFENRKAVSIMLTNVSLSYAVAVLLDMAGFSNYVFKTGGAPEPVIPYFFIPKDKNVAEILDELSVATQSGMFFDEYNNFVVMFKDYLFGSREADTTIDGNSSTADLVEIVSDDKKVFNDGTINYTQRFLQRSAGSLTQYSFLDKDKTWQYLPALLWEVGPSEKTVAQNEKVSSQSGYALGAVPLNADLSDAVPIVSGGVVQNNIIDVGDNAAWLGRYNGYLYSNGEIIRFDAILYDVVDTDGVGNSVWIASATEYQKYFANLPFNGKMYPTGLVRIYAEPFYYTDETGNERLLNGPVAKHGRGQFGTQITSHSAGLPSEWSQIESARSIKMSPRYLFEGEEPPPTEVGPTGISSAHLSSTRNGVIKNYLRDDPITEASASKLTTASGGTMQSSAMVFGGPNFSDPDTAKQTVTYVYKDLGAGFKHFGTRMRIVGKLESASSVDQTPTGGMSMYTVNIANETVLLTGGAGGLAVGVNPETNVGYFFELVALTNTNLEKISGSDDGVGVHNLLFYKVVKDKTLGTYDPAVPVKLWGGLADIIVDSGSMAGVQRVVGEEKTTVYDVSLEWKDYVGPNGQISARRFYLYVNGIQVATVDDVSPIPMHSTMATFVRGSSKVMFENVFALRSFVSENSTGSVVADNAISEAFGRKTVDATAFRRHGISGFVQQSYLSGISTSTGPVHGMYYEEFGAIMREASYFDIKFDKAYPALTAQISPTLSEVPAFVVSGFEATPYGAKFLVFNVMDGPVVLDETSGNYLRIQGVTFTQETENEYKVDDHFKNNSNLAHQVVTSSGAVLRSPLKDAKKYNDVKINRMKNGVASWSLSSSYIQTQAFAESVMDWLIDKTMRNRQLVGAKIFANPMIQLGDIVTIDYSRNGVPYVSPTKRFLVYNIEYQRSAESTEMILYMSEV